VAELVIFGAVTIFTAWVIFKGGAEWLEGTIESAILIQTDTIFWHAAGIKVYMGISWCCSLVWFLFL